MKLTTSLLLPYFKTLTLFSRRTTIFFLSTSPIMASSAKIVAEYARSKRSACKGCSNTIAANTLRLGIVTKDPRGWEATKWHHLQCFPTKSKTPLSVDSINGYALLRPNDQEAVQNLATKASAEEEGEETVKERPLKKQKVSSKNEGEGVEGGTANEPPLKKMKAPMKDVDEGVEEETVKETPLKNKKVSSEKGVEGAEEGTVKEAQSKKRKRKVDEGVEEEVIKETMKNLEEIEIELSESDVKTEYKGIKLAPNWKSFQTVIFLEKAEGLTDSTKIAAFDFDGCLAKTSVKKHGAEAWSLMFKTIPKKLKGLYEDGYKVVIFTNEANIERWKNKRAQAIESKIGRLDGFIKKVEIPVQVFIACGHGGEDVYRKPRVGMWRLMEKYFNSGIKVDMDESFYVGDAAGRETDHGDADSKFAETIGLKFHLPEDYFRA